MHFFKNLILWNQKTNSFFVFTIIYRSSFKNVTITSLASKLERNLQVSIDIIFIWIFLLNRYGTFNKTSSYDPWVRLNHYT